MSARARRASQSPPCVVFIAAEGPSEVGELGSQQWRPGKAPREGYFQPMLRKLMGSDLRFEGQQITVLGRFDAKKRLPGHADRAAMALALASIIDDCRVIVFAHDVDKTSGVKRSAVERRRSVERIHAEIEAGFAEVKGVDHIFKIKATPLRMIEAWALGDRDAVRSLGGKSGEEAAIPTRPEETWGKKTDPRSGHPKCLLRRAIGGRDPTPQDFADLATTSEVATLRESCPLSFAPFADEAEEAARNVVAADLIER